MIIFLDESGDLGFDFSKPKTSKKFVITLLACDSSHITDGFRKAVQRTLKNKLNSRRNKGRIIEELKGTGTILSVKEYFLRHVPKSGWGLYSVVLDKHREVHNKQRIHPLSKLYNYLAHFIISKIDMSNTVRPVTLVVDRSKSTGEIKEFNEHLTNHLEAVLPLNTPLYIHHHRSHDNPGLQVVDLFCWGIFKKYEQADILWYDAFKEKIVFEEEIVT